MADRKSNSAPTATPAIGGIEELVDTERDRIMDAMAVLALARKAAAANEDDDADLYRAIRTAEGLLDRTVDALDSVYVNAAIKVTVAEVEQIVV